MLQAFSAPPGITLLDYMVFFRETQIRKERENEFFRKCHTADNLSYDPI